MRALEDGLRASTAFILGLTAPFVCIAGMLLPVVPRTYASEKPDALWPVAAVAAWRDDNGQTFDLTRVGGRIAIVTMAYTHCRLICPMVFEKLQKIQQELDSRGEPAEFFVIGFAGVEDDPGAWHRYRLKRHLTRANWHFLSGTDSDTQRFARTFGFEYWRYDEHVMHRFQIFVFGADGRRRAQIDADDGPSPDIGP